MAHSVEQQYEAEAYFWWNGRFREEPSASVFLRAGGQIQVAANPPDQEVASVAGSGVRSHIGL